MKELTEIAKALSDEGRVRIVLALSGRELCVCQLVELLELAPSTVSKHLSVLKSAGLIDARKDGRWVFHRLAGEDASPAVKSAIAWTCGEAGGTKAGKEDERKLRRILKIEPEVLCCRIKGR